MSASGWIKARRRLVGVAFLAVLALLAWVSVATYQKRFATVAMVDLYTDNAGNEMHPQAAVKVRGVQIGEVRRITADGDGARLELALDPSRLDMVPADVTAQLLPTTLFGERYVALIPPARAAAPATARLAAGDRITQDRSANAIELERVLADLLPLLQAVQPQKLSVALTAVATALEGRGDQLGRTLVQLNSYLGELNPKLPALRRDLRDLAAVVDSYDAAAPDLVAALTDLTVTSRTVVDQRSNLDTLYGSVTRDATDVTTWLRQNRENIIRLSADSRSTLELLARYAPEFPCVLQQLTDFKPNIDKALGQGTARPGLRVNVTAVQPLGRYVPGRDTPRYDTTGGPHCYAAPFGGTGSTPAGGTPAGGPPAGGGPGPANSPAETELINELLAASLDTPPPDLPDWSSVLVGPLYRGTEVQLG
jgi:phospholipid/cholesterol/gamma-HCH transport system substrate-binding protein